MRVSGESKVKFFKTVPVGSWIATDIQWDTDGERAELPKEVFIQYVNGACGTELCISDDEIVDFLSDTYGYCVQGYNLKYLEIQ